MFVEKIQPKHITEASLIVICGALTTMLHLVVGYKMVILNLFYLPVVLAAFHLGRHRAALLAFFSVLLATVVAASDLGSFAGENSHLVIGISLIVWAGVMGLNALFVGTLSDERGQKIEELHDAYLGVVEVLAQYLKSADPRMNDRSKRVATLSQDVARRMRLSEREVDDIRVAALLQDIDNIAVTAKVIRRAVGDLKSTGDSDEHTFHGDDLVQSLGTVLATSLPLIVSQGHSMEFSLEDESPRFDQYIGAAIIHAVRQFDALTCGKDPLEPNAAIAALQAEVDGHYHPGVLSVLAQSTERLENPATDRLGEVESLIRLSI